MAINKPSKELGKVESKLNDTKQKEYVKSVLEVDKTSEDAQKIKAKIAKINLKNMASVDTIGKEIEERSSEVGNILNNYGNNNNDIKGVLELKQLVEDKEPSKVVKKAKGFLPNLNLFHRRDNWIAKAEEHIMKIDQQVNEIAANIDKRIEDRQEASNNLELASKYNKETAIKITMYIDAIDERIEEANENELPKAKKLISEYEEGTPEYTKALENYRDLLRAVDHLQTRKSDLATHRQVLLVTAEEMRTNQDTINKVIIQAQRAKTTAVQIFKVNAHIQLENLRSARDGEAYAGLIDASQRIMTQTNSSSNEIRKSITEENSKAIIDSQVFKDMLKENMETDKEVQRIEKQGKAARDKNIEELDNLNAKRKLESVKDITEEVEEDGQFE